MSTFIHQTSVIYPNVQIGKNVYIGAHCIIGAPPEKKGAGSGEGVIIKDNTMIHGQVCIDSGSIKETVIGERCYIMKGAYIAHDCFIEDDVTISAGVKLAGGVTIRDNTNIGMGVSVHQGIDVPSYCMLGMNAVITKRTDLQTGGCYVGNPAKFLRWNYKMVDLQWVRQ